MFFTEGISQRCQNLWSSEFKSGKSLSRSACREQRLSLLSISFSKTSCASSSFNSKFAVRICFIFIYFFLILPKQMLSSLHHRVISAFHNFLADFDPLFSASVCVNYGLCFCFASVKSFSLSMRSIDGNMTTLVDFLSSNTTKTLGYNYILSSALETVSCAKQSTGLGSFFVRRSVKTGDLNDKRRQCCGVCREKTTVGVMLLYSPFMPERFLVLVCLLVLMDRKWAQIIPALALKVQYWHIAGLTEVRKKENNKRRCQNHHVPSRNLHVVNGELW